MKFKIAGYTDKGLSRPTNQDAFCIKHALVNGKETVMAIMCDGMGGLSRGELASSEIVRSFAGWFDHTNPEIFCHPQQVINDWQEMLTDLNQKIFQHGKQRQTRMGSTFSGLFVYDTEYFLVHAGDSRIYKLDHNMEQLTEDHTVANRKVLQGKLTPEEAKYNPQRNVLTRCIGAASHIDPQITAGEIDDDVSFLLCSDGFRHKVSEGELYSCFHPDSSINQDQMLEKCIQMTDLVKCRNEKDNISSIFIMGDLIC